MKPPIHHKWALYIAGKSRSRFGPYVALLAAIVFGVWAWRVSAESYWGIPFGLFMFQAAASVLFLERRAFGELLAIKDAEIRRLQEERRASA